MSDTPRESIKAPKPAAQARRAKGAAKAKKAKAAAVAAARAPMEYHPLLSLSEAMESARFLRIGSRGYRLRGFSGGIRMTHADAVLKRCAWFQAKTTGNGEKHNLVFELELKNRELLENINEGLIDAADVYDLVGVNTIEAHRMKLNLKVDPETNKALGSLQMTIGGETLTVPVGKFKFLGVLDKENAVNFGLAEFPFEAEFEPYFYSVAGSFGVSFRLKSFKFTVPEEATDDVRTKLRLGAKRKRSPHDDEVVTSQPGEDTADDDVSDIVAAMEEDLE